MNDKANDILSSAAADNAAQSDFRRPAVLTDTEVFIWDEDSQAAGNYMALGQRLDAVGDLYRRPDYAGGLLLASGCPNVPPKPIITGAALAAVIVDRVPVLVVKDGKPKGGRIASAHLNAMPSTEVFLQEFPAVDTVTRVPMYFGGEFTLTNA